MHPELRFCCPSLLGAHRHCLLPNRSKNCSALPISSTPSLEASTAFFLSNNFQDFYPSTKPNGPMPIQILLSAEPDDRELMQPGAFWGGAICQGQDGRGEKEPGYTYCQSVKLPFLLELQARSIKRPSCLKPLTLKTVKHELASTQTRISSLHVS